MRGSTRSVSPAVRILSDRDEPIIQPAPVHNDKPALWDLVVADMAARDAFGRRKYKTPLQPHNGRDFLQDVYEEALDMVVYFRGLIYERDNP